MGTTRLRILSAAAAAIAAALVALPALAESVVSFNAALAVRGDGTVAVTERIVYDFGADQKHGIYRDIPLTAPNGPMIAIRDVSVTDGQGGPYPYVTSPSGGDEEIRIGDPNATVTGRRTYVIAYTVGNAVRGFTDHDELYWNVTGNGWQVPIGAVSANVSLPVQPGAAVEAKCYTGPVGSAASDCTAAAAGASAEFASTRPLGSGEGMSIVIGMPVGSVTGVATTGNGGASAGGTPAGAPLPGPFGAMGFLFVLFPVLVTVFVGIAFAQAFSRRGSLRRATKPVIPKELKNRSIVPEYEAPDGLPPIEVGTILDRAVDPTDITSVILDLAVRGYLKIRYLKTKVMLFTSEDFELMKLKDGADLATPADREVFAMLFRDLDAVRLSTLKDRALTLRESVKTIREETLDRVCDEGYFDTAAYERSKALLKYRAGGTAAALVVFFLALFVSNVVASSVLSYAVYALFLAFIVLSAHLGRSAARFGHVLTPKGVEALAKILGFKLFLEVTETDRLKMLDAPAMEPALFEKCLPYAVVFGVEKEWAKKFEGIYASVPAWYEDASGVPFNASAFALQVGAFGAAMNGSFGAYRGSGSFSSGFGGGGFSGGGSGGGGGGSW